MERFSLSRGMFILRPPWFSANLSEKTMPFINIPYGLSLISNWLIPARKKTDPPSSPYPWTCAPDHPTWRASAFPTFSEHAAKKGIQKGLLQINARPASQATLQYKAQTSEKIKMRPALIPVQTACPKNWI